MDTSRTAIKKQNKNIKNITITITKKIISKFWTDSDFIVEFFLLVILLISSEFRVDSMMYKQNSCHSGDKFYQELTFDERSEKEI